MDSKIETPSHNESSSNYEYERFSSQTASQILWSTGMLSEPIPNGFYSVIPEKRLKEQFDNIPTLEELNALGLERLRADVILVHAEKDKKLCMLKQLIMALVKGLTSNPAAVIKKIAGLVSDFYKRPNVELSPAKAALDEASQLSDNRGVQMLGQIKHGSCRPRAILFKVLADTVGLESCLMVGLPNEGAADCVDSYKHMSVIVFLNSIELLVDLMRCPGQLIPRSTKAIFMTHISAAGESDSAENDSCDSPLEPNSPLYGYSERVDPESTEKDDGLQYQRRLEASLNVQGPSLRNMMLRSSTYMDRKMSLSHSEPNVAATFWRRSRRKGLPNEGAADCVDSYKHMSVIVFLNSIELLVDLMRCPGQLIPRSTKAIFMTHISAAGESDSAENDSCDSPLEPNSPLYGYSERVDPESTEKDDGLQYQRRLEASLNVQGPSLRNMMLRSSTYMDRKMSLSHSEPNVAATFWRRSRRKVIAEQRTASSRFF
ncbi:unnamed protein product [Ilex paraguariensis]|uniref:EDR1/CTR1/ARMC3-like peptidase-like domain-containing protein n=1 Tax=Ilex paraguariensis TaxID=185542 RepID=A0ABC8QL56_9AQUA